MLKVKEGYSPVYDVRQMEKAIKWIKDTFERKFAKELNLERISAPLFVNTQSGLNDTLNGVERSVTFDLLNIKDTTVEIVQSLAKWKRMALYRYGFHAGEGIYTDMNAIRRDDDVDNTHSVYVDQWDWEKILSPEERTEETLKNTVRKIVKCAADTLDELKKEFPLVKTELSRDVYFVTSQELEDLYPTLTPKEREYVITKEHKSVFVQKIGGKLKSGQRHDGRAPDYDDWELNGDILLYNEVLDSAFEISSMGIRVNAESLLKQLEIAHATDRLRFPFHQMIANNALPLTIGGGIGQSRLCMLLLGCMHIGEVQASVWPDDMVEECHKYHIELL